MATDLAPVFLLTDCQLVNWSGNNYFIIKVFCCFFKQIIFQLWETITKQPFLVKCCEGSNTLFLKKFPRCTGPAGKSGRQWCSSASVGDRLNSRTATKHSVSHFQQRGVHHSQSKHKIQAEREPPMIPFRAHFSCAHMNLIFGGNDTLALPGT